MTIGKIYETGLIKDETDIFIRERDFNIIAQGKWYEDRILDYANMEVKSFTWQDDGKVYIDVK
ncbi:MAG: hypothetical protein K2N89_01325 [Lachnospiraceae bacterium]|nr:hypothetical protein [Lachnospiraceae bacterium]